MKVALAHDFVTSYTGAERVLKVLADMFPEAPIYTLLYDKSLHEIFPAERIRTSSIQNYPRWIRKYRKFLLTSFPVAIEQFDFSEFDVVISSSGAFSKGVLTKPDTLHVCYCHAPMRYAWDWNQEYLNEHNLKGIKRFLAQWLLKDIRKWDYVSSSRPDVYLSNSKATADKVRKYYHRDSSVVFPPVDTSRFSNKKEVNDGYYFIVSRLEPYKKIDRAIDVFNRHPDKKLVIAGIGSALQRLKARASSPNIFFSGFLDDEDITNLYLGCKAFLFPGEDDFGITAIEAMSAGKPVIAYKRGGTLETVKPHKTGLFFDSPTADSLENTLLEFEECYDSFDPHSIKQHAETFSTQAFIDTIKQVIKENI